jgi:V/A-type H+-transporting ATPase subunit I
MKTEGVLPNHPALSPLPDRFLKKTASEEGWAILDGNRLKKTGADAQPNPKAIRIIQPIFGLLGTVPGYREKDISFFFLVFFSIFFAMIIGDGGYGLIILAVSLLGLARAKGGKAQEGMTLILVMSVCSIIWGALTGTWFGIQRFAESSFLSKLILPGQTEFGSPGAANQKRICLRHWEDPYLDRAYLSSSKDP